MTALEKAPTILTRIGAERLTARIRQQLATVDEDLARAWEGRVWELMDHPTWAAWVAAELQGWEHVKLTMPARLERVKVLRLAGASERAIADACGVTRGQAHADVVTLRNAGELDGELATVTSLDGSVRPAQTAEPVQPATAAEAKQARHGLTILMHEAWQHVAGREDMTCLELEKRARWRHGRASSLLHRLERAGLVERTSTFRDGYGAYRARPLS
jgi:hypothetical protein